MAEQAFPFSAGAGASITDAQFQNYLAGVIGDGVRAAYNSTLGVSAGSGMQSNVATGAAYLTGLYYNNDASKALTHSAADPSNPRIDLVVVHLNLTSSTDGAGVSARSGAAIILAGTPAGSPTAPSVTQNSSTWEIPLYQVRVPAGAASSASFTYTDVRSYAHADIPASSIVSSMIAAGAVVDAALANPKVNKSGDTMSGALIVNKALGGVAQDYFEIAPSDLGTDDWSLRLDWATGDLMLYDKANSLGVLRVKQATGANSGLRLSSIGGVVRAWSFFTGNATGTYNHGLGTTPNVVLLNSSASAGSETLGWDSATGTQVHITNGGSIGWTALALLMY